jgi:hypothetical protein
MIENIIIIVACITVSGLIALLIYLICHPGTVFSWNTFIAGKIAVVIPEKRKKAFEMNINNAVTLSVKLFMKAYPYFNKIFTPYSLKTQWLTGDEDIELLLKDNQAIIYVNDFKDSAILTVSVICSYMEKGFDEIVKDRMSDCSKKAIDVFITQKVLQNNLAYIYDYLYNEYLPDELQKSKTIQASFNGFKQADKQGLFVPILLNELDRYSCYPAAYNTDVLNVIRDFIRFIYNIVKKISSETVPTSFFNDDIRIRVLMIYKYDADYNIDNIIQHIESDISNDINTVYVIAAGRKTVVAENLSNQIFKQYGNYFNEPKKISYTRYGKRPGGAYAVCYEICKLNNIET